MSSIRSFMFMDLQGWNCWATKDKEEYGVLQYNVYVVFMPSYALYITEWVTNAKGLL